MFNKTIQKIQKENDKYFDILIEVFKEFLEDERIDLEIRYEYGKKIKKGECVEND
jgi:hypothetical protein